MAKGDTTEGSMSRWVDEQLGYTILQPIAKDGNRLLYFTSNCFFTDQTHLLFSGERNGIEHFFMLNYITGDYTQLTDEPEIDVPRSYFDKSNMLLYYSNGKQIKRLCIRTLQEDVIYESRHELTSLSVTSDSKYLISSYQYRYEYKNNDQENRSMELYRMFRVDLTTGASERILDRNFGIDHIQCNPADPQQMMYCARGYYSTHHRIWHTNLEGTLGGPLGCEQPNEHRTHEYFLPEGQGIAYHGKYYTINPNGKFRATGHTWGRMNNDGSGDISYRCRDGRQAGHSCASSDGKLVVADGNDYISLLEFHEESREVSFRNLFRHDSSMSSNFVHPHPVFSSDDRYIAFCTDFRGRNRGNIYLLDLQRA